MKRSTVGVIKQYLAGTSAALSLFIAGQWLGWPSPAVKKFLNGETHLKIDISEVSWIVSLMDFGNILSPIPSGYLCDCIGRKKTLLLTAFLYITTWALTIFSTTAPYMYAARIGAGIGKGVAFTVVPMFLGEIAGNQVRGAISTMFTGLLYSGILFEYIIGPFVSYDLLNIISITVPIIFFVTFVLLPESPYYHLMKKRPEKAEDSLIWYRHASLGDEEVAKEFHLMTVIVRRDMADKGNFIDLLATSGNRRALFIVVFLSAFQRFGGISPQLAYTAITLPKTGGYFKPEMYMIIFGFAMVIGNFISTPLLDKAGRKPMLIISCTTCALLTGISAVFYWVAGAENDTKYNWIPYVCFVGYGITYSIGIGVIPTTFVGELFPTNIKSHASAIAAIFFAVASFLINKVYLIVKEHHGVHVMFIFFTLCSIASVIFTLVYVFETKGKTFAAIQDQLNNRRANFYTDDD